MIINSEDFQICFTDLTNSYVAYRRDKNKDFATAQEHDVFYCYRYENGELNEVEVILIPQKYLSPIAD
jgi:hypothetical protein